MEGTSGFSRAQSSASNPTTPRAGALHTAGSSSARTARFYFTPSCWASLLVVPVISLASPPASMVCIIVARAFSSQNTYYALLYMPVIDGTMHDVIESSPPS